MRMIVRIECENWLWELNVRIDHENRFWELIMRIDCENWLWELIMKIDCENWLWELILSIDLVGLSGVSHQTQWSPSSSVQTKFTHRWIWYGFKWYLIVQQRLFVELCLVLNLCENLCSWSLRGYQWFCESTNNYYNNGIGMLTMALGAF